MDKALLEKAMLAIEAEPDKFDMSEWVLVDGIAPVFHMQKEIRNPGCKTTMCLAGWVCHIAINEGREWPRDSANDPILSVGFAALMYLGLIEHGHQEAMWKLCDILWSPDNIHTPADLRAVLEDKGLLT